MSETIGPTVRDLNYHRNADGVYEFTTGFMDFGPGPHKKVIVEMVTLQTFIVLGEFEGMNEIIALAKSHWSSYAEMKRANTFRAWAAIKAARIRPVVNPVHLSFLWVCKDRRRDKDNVVAGGRKPILDSLEKAGIVRRDSWRLIAGFEDRFEVDKENPRVEVTLREIA